MEILVQGNGQMGNSGQQILVLANNHNQNQNETSPNNKVKLVKSKYNFSVFSKEVFLGQPPLAKRSLIRTPQLGQKSFG